jgi:NAD(P)-dependent dehydrogenase (short-subunit alcohol dehydrogenase family)
MRLQGKVAILFAREGADVVAAVHRPEQVGAVETEASGLPGRVVGVTVDVAVEEDVRRMVRTAVDRFGGLDIMFNNAGIELVGEVTETTNDDWFRILDVNLRSVFLACKYAVPEMLKRGGGSIVNDSSINGIRGNSRLVAYSATKGGVVALTRAMAIDYAARGIRVNCLCPASIDTPMSRHHFALDPDPEERRRAIVAKHPMGRVGRPEEVAYAALFLASDEASFITGVALPVDGGRSIR